MYSHNLFAFCSFNHLCRIAELFPYNQWLGFTMRHVPVPLSFSHQWTGFDFPRFHHRRKRRTSSTVASTGSSGFRIHPLCRCHCDPSDSMILTFQRGQNPQVALFRRTSLFHPVINTPPNNGAAPNRRPALRFESDFISIVLSALRRRCRAAVGELSR